MVTTKRRPATKRSPARSAPKSRGTTSSRSRSQASGDKAAGSASGIFSEHGADLWAIGLVTVGVLLALALYGAAAGSVGTGVDKALGTVIGWSRYLLPPACIGAGVLIIAGRRRPDPIRTGIGAGLGLLAVAGLAELAGGSPKITASTTDLSAAGGWVGAAVGRPLQLGLGTAGAVVVLVALAFVGIVLSTGVSLGSLGRALVAAGAAAGRTLSRWWAGGKVHHAAPDDERDDADEHPGGAADVLPGPTPWPPAADPAATVIDTGEIPTVPADAATRPGAEETTTPSPRTARPDAPVTPVTGEWRLPEMSLLKRSGDQRHDERQLQVAGEALVASLGAHGVDTRLVGRTVGPTVTRYELELGPGVKVARVTSLSKDIAYAMASPDVRILAPIPGKSAIGVEVPNRQRMLVSLGDILSSPEAAETHHPLEAALGRDIAGRPVLVNLADMPHVLISGATGAGKSSCINSLITSVLMRSTPDQVRMILVDPKRVELGHYNELPHLLTQVVVDPKKAANALAWAVKEMERRYDLLAEYGMRDITGYNEAFDAGELGPPGGPSVRSRSAEVAARAKAAIAAQRGNAGDDADVEPIVQDGGDDDVPDDDATPERLPFILVVVDELNDLMMVAARDVEDSVCRIAQMARAVGIHLVLATQRPSVDVITGVIKANIPSRLAFSVSSLADSRVILDQSGAERLIGKGDMLLLTASSSNPRRIQGPWVSEAEVRAVVAHWRRQGRTSEPAVGIEGVEDPVGGNDTTDGEDDELLPAALDLVVRSQLGSTSMLQRKLRVGFARAGRLMDLLERRGVVGPSEGSKVRAVLMTPEELDSRAH